MTATLEPCLQEAQGSATRDSRRQPGGPLLAVVRGALRNPLLRNGHLLTLSSTLTALVGMAYWAVATWKYDPSVIGSNSVALSLMMLAASVAQLNLGSVMIRFIPTAGVRSRRLVAAAYLVSILFAVVVGSGFALAIALSGDRTDFINGIATAVVFVAAVVCYAIFVIQDGILVGLRKTALVPVENFGFAVVKLALVVVLASALPRHGVFASWAIALGILTVVVGAYLFLRALPRHEMADGSSSLPPIREVGRFVAFDYVGAICSMASMSLLPVAVTWALGPESNAHFSIAWVVAYSVHMVSNNMGMSLVAETVGRPEDLAANVRHLLIHTGKILLPVVVAMVLLAPWILAIFGADYTAATTSLRLLLLAAVPHLVVAVAINSARVQRRLGVLVWLPMAQLATVAAFAPLLIGRIGVNGAALGWLLSQTLLASVLLLRRDWWWREPAVVEDGVPVGRLDRIFTATTVSRVLPVARFVGLRLRRLRRSNRRGRPEFPDFVLPPTTADPGQPWSTLRPVTTVSDVAVGLLCRPDGEPAAVLKVARAPAGSAELRSQDRMLTAIAEDPRLTSWAETAPRSMGYSTSGTSTVTLESYVPDLDLLTVLAEHPERADELMASALEIIGTLHRRTGSVVEVTDHHLEEWVDVPLAVLRTGIARMAPSLTESLDRVGSLIRGALRGQRILVSWTHADLTPENVRVTAERDSVSGIIDWGGAKESGPAFLDAFLLTLSVSRGLEHRELGALVTRRLRSGGLDDRERALIRRWSAGQHGDAVGSEPAAVLLTWLTHVSEVLRKCGTYRRNTFWWAANVVPVLRAAGAKSSLVDAAGAVPADPQPVCTVAVIICAYTEQRRSATLAAVASVQHQSRPPTDIIVVVDHNPALKDDLTEALPGVRVLANAGTRGLSDARNTGVAGTDCEIVAFLDDDAAAAEDWLEALVAPYADPAVLGVGGQVNPEWESGRPRWFPAEFDWVVGCSYRGMPTSRRAVRNFIGANMSLRRRVLVDHGFDPGLGRVGTLPTGCEETELCIAVQQGNPEGVLLYEPTARVSHLVPPARGRWSYFRSRCLLEGRSKAGVASLVGSSSATSTERAYLRRTIPAGLARHLGAAVRGRRHDAAAAAALVSGVSITAFGYLTGRLRRPPLQAVGMAALPVAVVLWLVSLPRIRVDRMADYGLVPLLPLTYWAALVVIVVSFATLVWRGATQAGLLFAHMVALILFLHGTTSVIYQTLRYSWAWKHVGVVDFFMRHDGVDGTIRELGAYQRWPGFFTLNATLAESTGLNSVLGYAPWAPFIFGILLLGPIYLIVSSLTGDPRLIWTAIVIWILGAWVGQDYFAPQPLAFFLYLTVVAFCLRYRSPPTGSGSVDADAPAGRGVKFQGVMLTAALLVMIAAVAPTHQLTPWMLISALAVLALFRYRVKVLVVGAIATTVGWDVLFAWPWIAENLASIRSSVGTFGENATSGFINLTNASPSQTVIARTDRALSALIAVLAGVGFLRRLRNGRAQWAAAMLAVAPVPMILANDYGGEMIFRVYLFALPLMAFYAASAFFPTSSAGRSRLTGVGVAIVLMAMVPAFVVAYFGKESVNHLRPEEYAISQYLYGTAPRGSLIVGATSDFPWAYVNYEFYDYIRFAVFEPDDRLAILADPVVMFRDMMSSHHHAYLVITAGQITDVDMIGAMPRGSLQHITTELTASPEFSVLLSNPSGVILTLAQPAVGGRP